MLRLVTRTRYLVAIERYGRIKDYRFASTLSSARKVAPESEADANKTFCQTLVNRGDFYGIKSRTDPIKINVETAVSSLKTFLDKNQRIYASTFVESVVLPLQRKDPAMLRMIKLDQSSYVPYFIRCCGLVLTDVSPEQRIQILELLLQSLKENNIKFDMETYNAIFSVWLENEYKFDVDKILEEVEIEKGLEPDILFYNSLLWRLAESKEFEKVNKMLTQMTSRGIVPNCDSKLSQIFAASAVGKYEEAKRLSERVVAKYGESKYSDCLAAQIRGSILNDDIERVRMLLRSAIIENDMIDTKKNNLHFRVHILSLPYDALFDIIWRLAVRSSDSHGLQFSSLSQQILDSARRRKGFFKRLMKEAERHISSGYYYTAVTLISDIKRIKMIIDNQSKYSYLRQLIGRLSNSMIRNHIGSDTIKDIANRLTATFGQELRIYDDLAYSITTFKEYNYAERFAMFARFVDTFDPDRSRPHIVLPLIARCPDLNAKKQLLFQLSDIGYSDIVSVSPPFTVSHIYNPILEQIIQRSREDDVEKLRVLSKVMESFYVKPEKTWRSLFDYAEDIQRHKADYNLFVNNISLKKWLSQQYEPIFKDKMEEAEKRRAKYTIQLFMKLLKMGDVERLHLFLIQRGDFPPEFNLNENIDPLLNLYLEHANFGYIKKLLQQLSNATTDSDYPEDGEKGLIKSESPIKCYHLLQILKRCYVDTKNIQSVLELVYELKRLFPDSGVTKDTRFESGRQFERLINIILNSSNVSTDHLNQCVDLIVSLFRHDFIALPSSEIATLHIVEKVNTRFGWDTAVDTWLKFLSNFGCPNGILALMRFAIEKNDNTKIQYLIHRSQNFVSSSCVNALLAAAYLSKDKGEEALEIFKKEGTQMQVGDCLNVFQILLQLRAPKNQKDTVYEFVELCLKYTKIRNDPKMTIFVRSYINHCLFQKYNVYKFYALFKKYGVYFNLSDMEKLSKLMVPQQKAFKKWVYDPVTAIVNATNSEEKNDQAKVAEEFEADYEKMKNEKSLESRVEKSTIMIEDMHQLEEMGCLLRKEEY